MPLRASRVLITAATGMVLAAIAAGPSSAAPSRAGNLLANPTAEATGTGVPGWAPSATPTYRQLAYGADGGYPSVEEGTRIGGGAQFFEAGASAQEVISQDLPIAEDSGRIMRIGGLFGGYSSQEDTAQLKVTFFTASDTVIGAPLSAGAPTSAQRGGVTKFVSCTASSDVPATATRAHVELVADRAAGSENDGYADNLFVTFDAGPTGANTCGEVGAPAPTAKPPALTTVVTGLPSTKKCLSRRSFRIRLRNPKGTKIEKAVVFVNGKRVITRTGKRVTAPIDLRGLPKGRYTVKISVVLSDGRITVGTRKYRTCTPKRK